VVWAAETNIKGPKGDKGDPGASGAATCFMSDTAPVGKPPGSLWWETDTGYLYALYDDGTSVQWVMVSPGSGGISQADADLRYVNVSGDTMTGALTVKTTLSVLDTAGFPVAVVGVDNTHKVQMYYDVAGNAGGISTPTSVPLLINSPNAPLTLAGAPVALHSSYSVPQADKSNTFATTSFVKAWAAPFDALAYNGMQINGGFTVSQEKGATPTSASGAYFCDGWVLNAPANGLVNASASASGPQLQALGLPAVCQVATTVAAPSLAAGDSYSINHRIEGYRTARLGWGFATNPQPITFGFWTAHARAGVYSFVVRNVAFTRTYAATYTQDAAGVWEYKTVTVPGCPDGVWNLDNTTGITINFSQGCGTTFTAPSANSWLTGNYVAAPGQINAVAATSDIFRLTGLVVLPGTEAPDAARAPLIMRPYDQELLTCKRYWEKSYDYATMYGTPSIIGAVALTARAASATATAGSGVGVRFQCAKRAIPTVVFLSTIDGAVGAIDISGGGGLIKVVGAMSGVGQNGIQAVYTTSAGGLTTGQAVETLFHYLADARL
jgi:hypothetical protein